MLRLFPLFLGSYFQITVNYRRRGKRKDCIGVYEGRLEGSVSLAKSGEICSSQRIKLQWAVIPPEWIGMAEKNVPVSSEH